jgi:hypothetical protein
MDTHNSKLEIERSRLFIIIGVLITAILLLIIYYIAIWNQCRISIKDKEIDYIMLEGFDVQIGDELLSGEINERIDDELAKRKILNYINNLDNLNYYRQGDPIIGTPSFQIQIFQRDGSSITIEEGGIIVVRNNNKEKWYYANDSFQTLFYDIYMSK